MIDFTEAFKEACLELMNIKGKAKLMAEINQSLRDCEQKDLINNVNELSKEIAQKHN